MLLLPVGMAYGQQKKVYENGNTYVGQLREGKRNGKGKMTYASGHTYDGEWKDDLREGKGTYDDGTTLYIVQWHNDKMNGYGEAKYYEGKFKGSNYKGNFKESMFNGQGTFVRFDGMTYTGNYVNHRWSGRGKYYNPELGVEYEGDFSDGSRNGVGVYKFLKGEQKGRRYEGEFRDGDFHGKGVLYYPNGIKYEGTWIEGDPQGEFKKTFSDGSVSYQIYQDGKVVSESKESSGSKASKTAAANTVAKETKLSDDPNDPFTRLDELIGLEEVKQKVRTLANSVKIQKMKEQRGMKTQPMSYHCLFLGNPGTGKTTVARILADIYRNLGVVKTGHLVETDRSGLIASYLGQTAPKVNHMCDSALNGILFIDEAYAITQGSSQDYGKEAVATLLKRMEDDRDKLVVILAGYSKEMEDFLEANSGLKSRINNYINFPDYSAGELFQIYQQQVKRNDCVLDKTAESTVKSYINNAVAHKDAYFGNARFVRNFVEKSLEEQANRLSNFNGEITDAMLRLITKSDVEHAIEAMKNNK